MNSRKVLERAVQVVAFLFAAFGGLLKGIAPPEEATASFSVGIGSFLALCVFLMLSARVKKRSRATDRRLWLGMAGALMVVALAAGLLYWHNRGRLTFSYPPGKPEAEYIAGTEYAPRAAPLAAKELSPSQIVAQFGGLPYRHLVWTPASTERARMILITNYLLFVLCIAGATFSLVEIVAS